MMMILLPLLVLSGSVTPRESMPEPIKIVMLAQAILFRGAGLPVVWPQFASLGVIGTALFALSLVRFRKTIGTMA